MGEYLVTDANLSGNPVVDDLDRQCTFFTADNGRTKFYFYCSHIDFFLIIVMAQYMLLLLTPRFFHVLLESYN